MEQGVKDVAMEMNSIYICVDHTYYYPTYTFVLLSHKRVNREMIGWTKPYMLL